MNQLTIPERNQQRFEGMAAFGRTFWKMNVPDSEDFASKGMERRVDSRRKFPVTIYQINNEE